MSMETQIEPANKWLNDRGSQEVWVMGRLKPRVTYAQAEADLDRIARQLARTYPNTVNPKAQFKLTPPGLLGDFARGPVTAFAIAFMSIAGMALLLACINLAGVVLARASDRYHEIGIRLAVGASRFQLVRQLMTESLLLALTGGLIGLGVAFGACNLFSRWHPSFDLPLNTNLHPNAMVLFVTLFAALLTTLIFGLTPALQAARIDLIPSFKNEPISNRFRRLTIRDLLVAGQIALSIVLGISSVLMVRSLQHALTLHLGFNPDHAVAVSFDLRLQGYDESRSKRFIADVLQEATALPGLQSVAVINNLPLRVGESDNIISPADRPLPPRSEWRSAIMYYISPGYFRTAGTKLLRGRDVDDHDREGTPRVMVVNEALAHLLFGNENPLGKHVRLGANPADKGAEIVGVVETGKYESLGENPHPAVFLPIAQVGPGLPWTTLVARSDLPAEEATDMLRKAVLDLDPNLTLFNAGSLKDQLAFPLFPARIATVVLGAFGLLAIVLAATGIFALVAHAVSRRRREIGIRMALGARAAQVLSSVLRRTLILCGVGICLGTIAALAAGRVLTTLLYGISPHDLPAFLISLVLMLGVALVACWHPAIRAIHIDPARTLREE